MQPENNIIFFDGVCNLCNSSVNFIIKTDSRKIFKFSHLQSKYSCNRLTNYNPLLSKNTILYLEDGNLYERSTAVLRIFRKLSGIWPTFYLFIIVPRFIRDTIYNFIARNRYKWFGKSDNCKIPTPEIRDRFIE